MEDRPGWVYFIQAGAALAPVKIGYTTSDVEVRRATLQAGNPERLFVIAALPGDRGLEQRLHARFADGRLVGEWFKPDTPGLSDFISDVIHFESFYPDDLDSPAITEVVAA